MTALPGPRPRTMSGPFATPEEQVLAHEAGNLHYGPTCPTCLTDSAWVERYVKAQRIVAHLEPLLTLREVSEKARDLMRAELI